MGWRSGAAFVRTALLKKEVAESRQRVRHKLRLLLLRYPEDASTRLSAIRAARLAPSAPPEAIRSSTMSTIAQCRHSSASSSLEWRFTLRHGSHFSRSFAGVRASIADHGPIGLLPRSEATLDMTR